MTTCKNAAEAKQQFLFAGKEHAHDITRIYQSVMINPQLLLDCISDSSQCKVAAMQQIKSYGGFISPPSDADMQKCLQHGLVAVAVLDGEMSGFNRMLTAASMVQQAFFSEFNLEVSGDYSRAEHFLDWSGTKKLSKHKTLKSIHFIDCEQAAIAARAARAGCHNEASGRLLWAMDAAVLPECQRLGLSRSMNYHLRKVIIPRFGCVAYRMFEIRKINNQDVCLDNELSKKAFKYTSPKHFAITEEEIVLRNDLTITVRWNHLLKIY